MSAVTLKVKDSNGTSTKVLWPAEKVLDDKNENVESRIAKTENKMKIKTHKAKQQTE